MRALPLLGLFAMFSACGGQVSGDSGRLEGAIAGDVVFEAESLALAAQSGQTFSDPDASAGEALLIWSNATASHEVSVPALGKVTVRAKGDLCNGAPTMALLVDGRTLSTRSVGATGWTDYATSVSIPAGTHTVGIQFANDATGSGCDRNLRVDRLTFTPAVASLSRFEAEAMTLAGGSGQVFGDASASGGSALLIWSNGAATYTAQTSGMTGITVTARGDLCNGAPHMTVSVDGAEVLSADVPSTNWSSYSVAKSIPDGAHAFSIAFTNDASGGGCDRNLRVDAVALSGASMPLPPDNPPPASGNPFAAKTLYVMPNGVAAQQAAAWRSSRPVDAAQMDKIARNAQAAWFGSWSGDVHSAVAGYVAAAAGKGELPVMIAYNIVNRDCGGFSSGGAANGDEYKAWIRALRAGIGNNPVAVVLEPDALAGLTCLSAADQSLRLALLGDAVNVLAASNIATYIDAGNSTWQSAATMADRLRQANVSAARGFALNVSNFNDTAGSIAFGADLAGRIGKHFVVDTSRNGLGSNGEWCNPSGRALGPQPTTNTGNATADALLWLKTVGESDGNCNGGPSAGTFWADYALGLAQRAAY